MMLSWQVNLDASLWVDLIETWKVQYEVHVEASNMPSNKVDGTKKRGLALLRGPSG